MVKIIRGTTPIIEIQVIGCDLKKYKHILITHFNEFNEIDFMLQISVL